MIPSTLIFHEDNLDTCLWGKRESFGNLCCSSAFDSVSLFEEGRDGYKCFIKKIEEYLEFMIPLVMVMVL